MKGPFLYDSPREQRPGRNWRPCILLEAVKEPLPSSTIESPTGTTGGATVVVENKSMTQKPLKTLGLSIAFVELEKTTMAI